MAKLIDRGELLNNRPEYLNPQMEDEIASARHQGWNDCNSYYYDLIIKQPTVDTERHAHWIVSYHVAPTRTKKILICSHCGKSVIFDFDNKNEFHYCPLCGAKMDEDRNESRNT